jgi:hypothetical protein
MQVKSDVNAKSGTIRVTVSKEGHLLFGKSGTIVGTNGKNMANGRTYTVKFADGGQAELGGSDLKELKPVTT